MNSHPKLRRYRVIILLVIFIPFISYGYEVYSPKHIAEPFFYFGLGIGIALSILFLRQCIKSKELRNKWVHSRRCPWLKFPAPLSVIGIPIICCVYSNGLIVIAHFFTAEPAQKVFTIKIKSEKYNDRKRRCDGSIYVEGYYKFISRTHHCVDDKEVWNQIQVGSQVLADGYQSPFGFRISSVELYEAAETNKVNE